VKEASFRPFDCREALCFRLVNAMGLWQNRRFTPGAEHADSMTGVSMSYEAYKFLHLLGIFILFASLGGLAALRAQMDRPLGTGLFNFLHGISLVFVLVAGFGLLTRLEMSAPGSWPTGVWVKLVVWILLGAGLVAIKKAGKAAGLVLLSFLFLGALAAGAAIFKF